MTQKKAKLPELLYFGTSDIIAKTLTNSGLNSPVILSDVYGPHFAYYASVENKTKWAIVEISTEHLHKNYLFPFHGYLERYTRRRSGVKTQKGIERRRKQLLSKVANSKIKWLQSFNVCGTLLYMYHIKPHYIEKITTYDAFAPSSNKYILDFVGNSVGPWETTPAQHRKNYEDNKNILDWLLCKEMPSNMDWTYNRNGLDMFYKAADSERERNKLLC